MTRHRTPDMKLQIDRLEHRHSQLSARVAELDRQLFLSTQDELRVRELKREKLAAKDAIAGLRRSS